AMPMTLWSTWKEWLTPTYGGFFGAGGWSHDVLFVVLFCALVDFVKLVIELMGRSEGREFRSDPSQVTAIIACRNGASDLPGTIEDLRRYLPAERIFVVDDGSTDGSADVARRLGCTVFRFDNKK